MKKKYQFAILISQLIISTLLIIYILFSLLYSIRMSLKNIDYYFNLSSYLIQIFSFAYVSFEIYQMNDPRRQSFTIFFLLALLSLTLNILLITITLYNTFNLNNLPLLLIGKLNLFTLFCSSLFLIFCGINQNVKNIKNITYEISFIFFISIGLSYIIPLSSPTINNQFIMLIQPFVSKIIYISLIILAIFSFIPSYIQDKSSHNKFKTISFILFVIAIGYLNFSYNINLITKVSASLIILFSSFYLIRNLKSYSI